MNENTPRVYTVVGMRCEHCRAAVIEELDSVTGIDDVAVDLASGRLEVRGAGFDDASVRGAVEEAGYRLADAA